jgi:hypothetical protein
MARILTHEFGRYAFREIAASTTPAALEQFKLERLFELRAVIDALRSERMPGDPHDLTVRDPRSRQ